MTHNHEEGLCGTQATVLAVFLAKQRQSKAAIKNEIMICPTVLIPSVQHTISLFPCQRTVPVAIRVFLESSCNEDAIRNMVSGGGDCNTIATITGGIVLAYYKEAQTVIDMFPSPPQNMPCSTKSAGNSGRWGFWPMAQNWTA